VVEDTNVFPADVPEFPDPYELVSIRAVSAPAGTPAPGADWHRYEISQGENKIIGYRAGAAETVRETVEDIVVRLNLRRTTKRGRVHVVLDSKARRELQ
jgi:hypothetical protein